MHESTSSYPLTFHLDLTQTHDQIISSIFMQLKEGNYQHWVVCKSLITMYQTLDKPKEVAQKIKNIINNIIDECATGIKENNSDAMVLRALLYRQGWGSDKDYPKAIELYDKAVVLLNAEAMVGRASMYKKALGCSLNYAKAIELLDRASNLGSARALKHRANMYLKGLGVFRNYTKAIELYDRAIDSDNNAEAMCDRAFMHVNGLGGVCNYTAAMQLYKRAGALGNIHAMCHLAHLLSEDLSATQTRQIRFARPFSAHTKNYPEAIELYKKAGGLGSADALFFRATLHLEGLGGPVNQELGLKLVRKAADLGKNEAITYLAKNYEMMNNWAWAARFHRKSAELGNEHSATQLATNKHKVFHYHNLMLHNHFDEATKLIPRQFYAFKEFIEFDLPLMIANLEIHELTLATIIAQLINKQVITDRNDKLLRILHTLDNEEKKQGVILNSDVKFCLISEINFADSTILEFKNCVEIVYHEYCKEGDEALQPATKLLFKLFYAKSDQLKLMSTEKTFDEVFIKLCAILVLKAAYGNIRVATTFQPTIEQFASLLWARKNGELPTLDYIFKNIFENSDAILPQQNQECVLVSLLSEADLELIKSTITHAKQKLNHYLIQTRYDPHPIINENEFPNKISIFSNAHLTHKRIINVLRTIHALNRINDTLPKHLNLLDILLLIKDIVQQALLNNEQLSRDYNKTKRSLLQNTSPGLSFFSNWMKNTVLKPRSELALENTLELIEQIISPDDNKACIKAF